MHVLMYFHSGGRLMYPVSSGVCLSPEICFALPEMCWFGCSTYRKTLRNHRPCLATAKGAARVSTLNLANNAATAGTYFLGCYAQGSPNESLDVYLLCFGRDVELPVLELHALLEQIPTHFDLLPGLRRGFFVEDLAEQT